ncbi:unnamed protein product [Notodromas monacha]|uniref:BOS complex subunit TMEM147 n=1 Tax=Notodromas monacha TaxID=399045 RepID=A0A7R9BH51_9CRUS|nr:unnamed protein product [Notodromas monacha]CAG0914700.1 unnamed protein product [Notodromas monacha]
MFSFFFFRKSYCGEKMTLYHFVNCLALGYTPYFLTYKYSGMSEYGVFWKCVQAGIGYVLTQLVKMLLLATFFPSMEGHTGGSSFDFFGEFLRTTVDLGDLLGIYLILSHIGGKNDMRLMAVAVGWSMAEFVLTKLLPLWVGARGLEFDWKHMQSALDSNVALVANLASVALVWMWSRNDLTGGLVPLVLLLLLTSAYKPLIVNLTSHALELGNWHTFFVKTSLVFSLALLSFQVYIGLAGKIGN